MVSVEGATRITVYNVERTANLNSRTRGVLFWRSSLLGPDRVSRGDRRRCGWLGGEGEDGRRLSPLYEGEYVEGLEKDLKKKGKGG